MSIREKLQDDIKTAMRAKERDKLTVLRGISAAIKQYEVDNRKDATEEVIKDILNKEVKKRKDALSFAQEAGREELVKQNEDELEIIYEYTGKPLSTDEITSIVTEAISAGANNIGAVMGALNKDYKGRFDGKEASAIIKEKLGA